jgi:hypothetical protein
MLKKLSIRLYGKEIGSLRQDKNGKPAFAYAPPNISKSAFVSKNLGAKL